MSLVDSLKQFVIGAILVIMFIAFCFSAALIMKDIDKNNRYRYIDLNNNEGIAEHCTRNMVCRIDNRRIKVKEYWIVKN